MGTARLWLPQKKKEIRFIQFHMRGNMLGAAVPQPKRDPGGHLSAKHSSLRLEEPALPQGQIFNQSLTLPFTGQKMLQVWIHVSLLNSAASRTLSI